MKLLTRTGLYFFLTAIPVFVAAIFVCYYYINDVLHENIDETLDNSRIAVEKYIEQNPSEKSHYFGIDSMLYYRRAAVDPGSGDVYIDTLVYSQGEKEMIPHRVLKSFFHSGNEVFEIHAGRNSIEADDLFDAIMMSLSFIFGFVVLLLFIINYSVSRSSWKPFHQSLALIRDFNLNSLEPPVYSRSNIVEFNQLNRALSQMTDKIIQDYASLRQFTENASHELQTPLAGIKLNLDLLIQSQKLGEEEMKIISRIYQSADKLIHLNRSLILLSKIENNQFREEKDMDVKRLVQLTVENYAEMAEQKKLIVKESIAHPLMIRMNPVLAEVLIGNLYQNAIKHNVMGGDITLESPSGNRLRIINSGQPLKSGNTKSLFERFRKDDDSSSSIGLGLAIVKQVCDLYSIGLNYSATGERHTIELSWNVAQDSERTTK